MQKHRIALPLIAATLAVVAVFAFAWAMTAPGIGVEHRPVPPRAVIAEPTAVPVDLGDDDGVADFWEPEVESVSAALDAEPLALSYDAASAAELRMQTGEADAEAIGSTARPLSSDLDAAPADEPLVLWADGAADKSLRNRDFPNTFISRIDVDLTSPHHWVRLTWTGPQAADQESGPFHSSPGAGLGNNDCDDETESNRDGSNCTPKGDFAVEAFSDTMRTYTQCRFVTWFNVQRGIAFHSYFDVPNYPASHGCVRLNVHAAQLIHNNSLMGMTKVAVGGTWTPR